MAVVVDRPQKACDHYDDVIMTMLASQITSLTVVYSIVYSGVNQRKHQSSASLAFVREIHRGPVNFPHKWPITRKMFPFHDVIMIKLFMFNNIYIDAVLTLSIHTLWVLFYLQMLLSAGSPSQTTSGCCESGRPIFTDPSTGQTICSCQYVPGVGLIGGAASRAPGVGDSLLASAYAAHGYLPLGGDPSTLCATLVRYNVCTCYSR